MGMNANCIVSYITICLESKEELVIDSCTSIRPTKISTNNIVIVCHHPPNVAQTL